MASLVACMSTRLTDGVSPAKSTPKTRNPYQDGLPHRPGNVFLWQILTSTPLPIKLACPVEKLLNNFWSGTSLCPCRIQTDASMSLSKTPKDRLAFHVGVSQHYLASLLLPNQFFSENHNARDIFRNLLPHLSFRATAPSNSTITPSLCVSKSLQSQCIPVAHHAHVCLPQ